MFPWNFVGEKSVVGTLIESVFGISAIWCFLRSKRVKTTFVT